MLLGCSAIPHTVEQSSGCMITYEEMSMAKAQLGKNKAELTLAGNTFSVSAGIIQGFYGDWALDYTIVYDPPCHFDEQLVAVYGTESVSVITFVWSSWKDELVDVYPNRATPPKGYFNPPNPYANK